MCKNVTLSTFLENLGFCFLNSILRRHTTAPNLPTSPVSCCCWTHPRSSCGSCSAGRPTRTNPPAAGPSSPAPRAARPRPVSSWLFLDARRSAPFRQLISTRQHFVEATSSTLSRGLLSLGKFHFCSSVASSSDFAAARTTHWRLAHLRRIPDATPLYTGDTDHDDDDEGTGEIMKFSRQISEEKIRLDDDKIFRRRDGTVFDSLVMWCHWCEIVCVRSCAVAKMVHGKLKEFVLWWLHATTQNKVQQKEIKKEKRFSAIKYQINFITQDLKINVS